MRHKFTDIDRQKIISLIASGLDYVEIAKQLNISRNSLVSYCQRKHIRNPNYMMQKTKHKHLREPVFEYFLTHTWHETKSNFKLTHSELKSIFTVGYRDKKLSHLRKDSRLKSNWTTKQLLFLVRHSGLRNRNWIASELGRGNVNSCIKERLSRLGVSSRTLNGITLSSYRAIFQKEPRVVIKTDAGPAKGNYSSTFFKIIPWTQVYLDIKDRYVETRNHIFIDCVRTMTLFQEWIFQGNVMSKIHKINKGVYHG